MFSLETGTVVHKGAAHSPGRPASRSGYAGDRALRRKSEEAGAKIAPVGKDVSMKVQANSAGTADQRREQMLRAALEVINERGYADSRIADVAERAGTSPMAAIPTAAGRLEEVVAMSCLAEADADTPNSWVLWLDLWAQALRHPEVATVRQKYDERWRQTISSLEVEGQEAGEFGPVDPADFALLFSALLDGLAIQSALGDPSVDEPKAFGLAMSFAADRLGFTWTPRHRTNGR